ncbi:MAG: hypothetical protein ACREA7_10260 [Nitrosotalea sp.]
MSVRKHSNNGNLYKFELNPNRDGFVFQSPQLQDDVADVNDSMDEIMFGTGFGCMTDIKVGPDGFVYIVSLSDGTIYRLIPKQYVDSFQSFDDFRYLVYLAPIVGVALAVFYLKRSKKRSVMRNKTE